MIVWPNGTFGTGKTTTATELVAALPGARVFDSEWGGVMLRDVLGPADDFQDWPPWRGLVVETAAQVHAHVGGTLVVPQTPCRAALPWLRAAADTVVDTANSDPPAVAARIAAVVRG